jgi:hypothetical protein
MATLFESAPPNKQPRYDSLYSAKFFAGLVTNRNALHNAADVISERYYGGKNDALLSGLNVELRPTLSLGRRYGLTKFSDAIYPTTPLRAFSFQLTNGTIQVIVDTGTTGSLSVSSVANASGSSTVYTGTFGSAAASNAFAGLVFKVTGFVTNLGNNGTFTCTASSTTTLTLSNSQGIAETHAASAVSFGAVFYDQQSGGNKTLLFAKQPLAGQTGFAGVAGILYGGDGVSTWKYVPGNTNRTPPVYNWGIAAPTTQPQVTVVPSGAAAVAWTASTYFSTMGLLDDGTNIHQLQSVNASGTNTTQFGLTGDGSPAFNNAAGGTTNDGSIVWTCKGPIVQWQAGHTYNDATTGGTENAPCIVYDSKTSACYFIGNPGGVSGVSGSTYPNFKPGLGQITHEGKPDCKWFYLGSLKVPPLWQKSHNYPKFGTVSNDDSVCGVVDPVSLVHGLPTSTASAPAQEVFWQVSSGGTSASSATAPLWATIAGNTTTDGDLKWMCLGSRTRLSNHSYNAWTANGTPFDVIIVNGNFHVCTTSGTSAGSPPTFSDEGYGGATLDGTVVWTCVGVSTTWTTSQKWFLPVTGFAPPSSSQPYGGAAVLDSNSPQDVEFIVNSGLSGGSAPSWNSIGGYTVDNPTSLTLTQVTVSGTTTTYTGTITGGGSNALVGKQYLISGFTNAGNNILIVVTASTATTLVTTTTSQVNETHAGSAKTGAIWFNLEQFTTKSLAWQFGHNYAISFKSRALDDFYSTPDPVTNALPVPPGLNNPLPAPTGSLTGAVSSASPVFTITGADTGAVNTLTGFGSLDPQVDTIVIWRDADGGGPSALFELTEIPNPPPINGLPGQWKFQDFLPDIPTTIGGVLYPGLDELIPAPIDDVNDPPPAGFVPHVFNFNRIFGAVGSQVFFSGGPDTQVGNPNECFNPADELLFLAPVTRMVRTSQGPVVTFTTDSVDIILGGPSTSSFYTTNMIPTIGLPGFNALDVQGGEIIFFGSDFQLHTISPSLNFGETGFPIADQLANLPVSGVSDATWNPATAYVAAHQAKLDTAVFLADGITGFYRMNPYTVGGISTDPTWSPFAAITNGCTMVESVETSPGIRQLLVGPTGSGKLLYRDLTVFTDNGTPYDAFFTVGSLILCKPGQIAALRFFEGDFSSSVTSSTMTVKYLLNEISGSFSTMLGPPVNDPPGIYGDVFAPTSYSPLRYYFASNASLALARHMQLTVDFGATSTNDQIFNFTLNGKLVVEK